MEQVLQRASECVLAVFRSDDTDHFKPELLTLLEKANIPLLDGLLKVRVRIIGESHCWYVEDRQGRVLYAEILACKELSAIGMQEPGSYTRLAGNPSFALQFKEERGVSAKIKVAIGKPTHSCQGIANKILACPKEGYQAVRLMHSFPFEGANPRTVVGVQATTCDHIITVEASSLHEYYDPSSGLTTPLKSSTVVTINKMAAA